MQARRQVGSLAQRQLLLTLAAPHLPHDDQAGMDAQARRQVHASFLLQARVELSQGVDHPQPGSHGALLGGKPETAIKIPVFAALYNDADFGIDDAGIARLPVLEARGISTS